LVRYGGAALLNVITALGSGEKHSSVRRHALVPSPTMALEVGKAMKQNKAMKQIKEAE
jgi:hypothetical protein